MNFGGFKKIMGWEKWFGELEREYARISKIKSVENSLNPYSSSYFEVKDSFLKFKSLFSYRWLI